MNCFVRLSTSKSARSGGREGCSHQPVEINFLPRVRQFQAGSSQAHQAPSQSGPASRESFSGKRTLFEVELSWVVPEQRSCRRTRCRPSKLT